MTALSLFVKAAAVALCLVLTPVTVGAIVYVDENAAGAQSGITWGDAYTDLQAALADPAAGEIWVAAGTYTPAAPDGDRNATFRVRSGQALYGGFAGGEISRDERDPAAHATVLSGDLSADDGDTQNGPWADMGENSYHVVTVTDADTVVVDGFTITRGWSWQAAGPNSAGAGLFVTNSSLNLSNCTIRGNIAHLGAGLYNFDSPTVIVKSTFSDNYVPDGRGGAIYHDGGSTDSAITLAITDSRFIGNVATPGGGPGDAGAIWSGFNAPVDIDGCLFERNEARWRFAYGNFAAGGGAMLIFGAGSRIANSVFRSNRAHVGGALWIGRDTTIVNSLFIDNEAFRQSVDFYDYGGYAGGIYCSGNSTALIAGSTFHANTARNVGGVWANPNTTIIDSILWSNTSTEEEATLLDQQLTGDPAILHSCIKGLFAQEPGGDPPPDPADYPGVIVADPLFVDEDGADGIPGTTDDDLRLSTGSPCIDAGDNAVYPASILTDLGGNPRFFDDPASADTGPGTAPIVDMGAYEHGPWVDNGDNLPPTASFTYEIDANAVTFRDSSTDPDGNIVEWIWDFGDYAASSEQNPTHSYTGNGAYVVTLTVRDDRNGTDRSASQTITIDAVLPLAVTIAVPAAGSRVANFVTLRAETTNDPSVVQVKFYDNGVFIAKATAPPFEVVWDTNVIADGSHSLTAKATDIDEDEVFSAPIVVTVDNQSPLITSAPFSTMVNVGDLFTYQVLSNGDPAPTFSLVSRPLAMTIDGVTGLISFTPSADQIHGLHTVTVRAANPLGSDDQSSLVTVVDSEAPGAPIGTGAVDVTETSATLVWDTAADNVAVLLYQLWKYVKVNQFPGHWRLWIDNIDDLSVTISPDPNERYAYKYAVKAVDTSGNVSLLSETITFQLALPPSSCLDVDADAAINVATDLVYTTRRLLSLAPVPPSYRVLDPSIPSDAACGTRIDALGDSLDVDGNGIVDVATDITFIARHFVGLTPVPASFRDLSAAIPPDAEIAQRADLLLNGCGNP